MTITEPTVQTTITVEPQAPTIGAEISGIDLSQDLSDDQVAEIRRALLDWKVLFFRDQDITTAQHLAFSRRFGELEVHPFAPSAPNNPEILAITHDEAAPGQENGWHSDVTWRLEPSLGSVLRLIEGPSMGGDTLFADMYAAYDGLPDEIKERVDGLTARHDFTRFKLAMRKRGASDDEIAEMQKQYPNPHHPVIRTHPETGRKGIYVNAAFTKEIDGLPSEESDELLSILFKQAMYPEYQVRLRWEPNTIAFWDNRSVQHYACSDYWPQVRKVERATIIGDAPYFDPSQAPTDVPARPFMGQVEFRRKGLMPM
ncbi:MAG: TauD/TfdA dioxygenase family protein [Ilumatobacter sp.]